MIQGREGVDTNVGSGGNDMLIGGLQSNSGDAISDSNAVLGKYITPLHRYAIDRNGPEE